jgi:drug/metabolite transporter (DMT)-like permease
MQTSLLGILFSLTAALSWGSGDFSGGLATRKIHQFQVMLLSALVSIGVLLVFGLALERGLPSGRDALLSLSAGVLGAAGLAALYRGLSTGSAALVAPVSAVVGAIVPTVVGSLMEGYPETQKVVGFGLALLGIWLVARVRDENPGRSRASLGLAIFAGIGFGGFMVLIAQVGEAQVFMPLVLAKLGSFLLALGMVLGRKTGLPNFTQNPLALLCGLFDSGGNVFYLLATHFTRLDVAVVLSSLCPAVTVLLSIAILKEKVAPRQWLGVIACLLAIVLISV